MKLRSKLLTVGAICAALVVALVDFTGTKANATGTAITLSDESVGASIVFSVNAYNNAEVSNLGITVSEEDEVDSSNLVMVKSTSVLNVRESGDSEATVLGKLYRDCGGIVLERGDEWSLIESGDLVGWCSNEYLLFDEEAEAFAKEVGTMYATVQKDCIKIYAEADTSSEVLGLAAASSTYEVIYEEGTDWLCIACDEYDGFVRTELVDFEFDIDHGETMEAIKERKRKEEEEKKKLVRQNEAIEADGDTLKMLATIIWCEARGESYDGQLAVGSVIMNRVRSSAYPDSVYAVIYASGQFSPVRSGSFQKAYANDSASASCYQAAQQVLDGYTNIGDMTHFRRAGNRNGYVIGNHVFY